ncbi:MAG: macB 1 [Gemmataceae bacterium]|nr:macB 1 [Gemmataceae bacterium]
MVPAVYRLLGLRYVLHRWDRAVLIVASIALGVATLVSARILNQCLEAAAQDTTTPAGGADLYVTNGEAGVLRALTDEVRAANIPGVRSVQPIVYERVSLPQLDNRIAVLIGLEVSSQLLQPDNPLKVKVELTREAPLLQLAPLFNAIQDGEFARASELWDRIPARMVMVTRPVYDEWKRQAEPGRPLLLRFAGRDVECLPVGVVEFAKDSALAALGGNFVGMEVGQAARVIRPAPTVGTGAAAGAAAAAGWEAEYPTKVNRLDVFLDPGADRDRVAAEVGRALYHRAKVHTPEDQRRSTQEVVSGLQIGFLVCSAGAMIVGLFLVYNALAVTVAERRPDIGVLRSLGATRGQIVVLFAAAAAALGTVGAALGVPLGALLAEVTLSQFATELESMFLNPEINPTRVTWLNAALAVLAGVATAVFAALVPAVQAAADDPAHVVRRSAGGAKGVWRLVHRLTCVGLVGVGAAAILLRHDLPPRVGAIGGMMIALVGLLLAAPIVIGMLVAPIRPVVRATCGVTLRLAFDNLSRAPGRTGVVIGALGAGVAMMFQTAGVGRSNEEPVVAWIRQVVQADYFVLAGNMTTANSSNSPMAAAVVRDLKALPAVEQVMAIRYSRPEFNGTVVYLIALDAEAYTRATRARVPAGLPDLERFLELPGTNDVLVSENFARRHGVGVGQTIALPGPNGPVPLRVIGTVRDYSWSRGTIFMDRARYARLFGDELIDICHVFLKPDQTGTAAGSRPVEAVAAANGLFVTDKDSLRKFLSELINRVYLLAYLQQIVVGVVAALGVVTALLISVLQRKRELGLLLAIGATPGQVLRSVLAEAVLMGVFGTALGVLIGLPMEWYVLRVVLVEESGFVFDVVVPWREALGIAAAAVTTAAFAGLVPAIHAVRTRIPDAIQWE